jgi:hypothetical protein
MPAVSGSERNACRRELVSLVEEVVVREFTEAEKAEVWDRW